MFCMYSNMMRLLKMDTFMYIIFFLIDLSYLLYYAHHLAFQVLLSFTAKIISVMKL